MLAWLFDPLQGHGLSDLFIRELIKNCFLEPEGAQIKALPFFRENHLVDMDGFSFSDTLVFTEFKAGEPENSKGNFPAIDIAMVSHEKNLMIFIENKFGASEGTGQRKKYQEYLSSTYGEKHKYASIFIYLDSNYGGNGNDEISIENPWIFLNYDWIERLLKTVVNQQICHPCAARIIKDYYLYLSCNYEYDPFFKGSKQAIKKLSKAHPDIPQIFAGLPEYDLEASEKDSYVLKLQKLFQKYHLIIDEMADYDAMDFLGEHLVEKLNIDQDCIDTKISKTKTLLYVTRPLFDRWADENEDGYWPINIEYSQPQKASFSLEEAEQEQCFEICIFIDLAIVPEKYRPAAELFIKIRNKRLKPRNNCIEIQTFTSQPSDTDIVEAFRKRHMVLSDLEKELNCL
ncbi:MAG: PD-(D/E)XK nuclease family protein [Desulfobacterium sp.]|nr:PD-(D/E)XK nuclease family protein [Desulfobacterium sp.]